MGWLSDIGNAVSSAAGAVGDVVEGAVDTVVDTVEDAVDTVIDGAQEGLGIANTWLCQNTGSVGCRFGNIVLGGVSGLLEGVQDMADKAFDIIKNAGGAIGALLRGDLSGFIGKLGDIFLDVIELGLNVIRFIALGTVVGGIRDAWQATDLRRFVESLLKDRFGNDPAQLTRIRSKLGLDNLRWGFNLKATHKVFRLDSGTAPLWQWHKDGVLDLYAMAGITSFDSFNVRRKRSMVRTVNDDGSIEGTFPINRWTLSHYIDSNGKDGRIRAYALTPEAVKDFIQVATDKFKKLGINLKWNDGGKFEYFVNNATHDISTLEEFNFDRRTQGAYILNKGLRTNGFPDQCDMLSLATFKYLKGLGQTSGRSISEGEEAKPCNVTPDRDDSCCNSINSSGPGVTYHDEWPTNFMRYVLAHEGGHYVGLCHYGHDGFQNVMFTPAEEANLSYADWGLFKFYLDNEPSFSLSDAKNVWRFIVSQMLGCLDDESTNTNPDIIIL